MYSFIDSPRNQPAFPINNFLLIPATVLSCCLTPNVVLQVDFFRNFIIFPISLFFFILVRDLPCLSERFFKDGLDSPK